jgi:hypothetical protein
MFCSDAGAELCQRHAFNFIVLVGGFGASELLRQRMQKTVNRFHGCKLITPLRPAVSVEYGAVLFGLTQASFASRVARYTYGIGIDVKLCPTNAKRTYELTHAHRCVGTAVYDGVIFVKDVFRTFVKLGDSVECDSVVTQCVNA